MNLRDIAQTFMTADEPRPVYERGALEDEIAAAVSERTATFSMSDALTMPPVARAVDLICSTGASFPLVEYEGGLIVEEGSSFTRRPDPRLTRYEFTEQILLSIVEDGEAFIAAGERIGGYPLFTEVVAKERVEILTDTGRPQYRLDGRNVRVGEDLLHVAINRRPGDLHGRSVLREALPYLAVFDAAEEYARVAFGSGGVPATVLEVATRLSKDEADRLKASWANSRQNSAMTGEPAVLSSGISASFPTINPEQMQMTEARSQAASTVARLMGIPAPLLIVETSGANLQYSNVENAIDGFIKTTLGPRYLMPVQEHLSDLTPSGRSVRYTSSELSRADVLTRYTVYGMALDKEIFERDEVRANEGLPPAPPALKASPRLASAPQPEEMT